MTISFPNEDRVQRTIQQGLDGYFSFAKRLLRFWLEADKNRGLDRTHLPPIVLHVLVPMNVKACRQFRSVIELCERGEAVAASAIARSMFETAAVVRFVLKPRFVPRRFNKKDEVTKTINVPGVKLTQEFRATLFAAHHVLQPERVAERHAERPGMKRHAKLMEKLAATDNVAQTFKDAIGPEWTRILLNHPRTYSGLSLSDLARSLGRPFPQWYDQVYGRQSEHVHAADMLYHLQLDEGTTATPIWHDRLEDVEKTLLTAIAMFYTNVDLLNKHIKFGTTMDTALHAFHLEYDKLMKAEGGTDSSDGGATPSTG